MKRIAIVNLSGIVSSTWCGGDEQNLPEPSPGWTYVALADETVDPSGTTWGGAQSFTVPSKTVLTRLEFRDLFTTSERAAIRAFEVASDAQVVDAMEALRMADSIDRTSQRIAAFLTMLVNKAVLTSQRRAAIIAGQQPA